MQNTIVVPAGKKLLLHQGGEPIPEGVDCILEEDITLSLSSTFAPIVSGGLPTLYKLLAQALNVFVGIDIPVGFKQLGYQLWQSTDPLSFSATIGFYMDTNAKKDVYIPSIELMKLPLPSEIQDSALGGLKAPGPTLFSLLEDFKGSDNDGMLARVLSSKDRLGRKKTLSLQIGQIIYLSNIIVKKAEPTFSIETDSNGYPIWSKIRLDISSVNMATTDMLDNRLKSEGRK